MNATETRVLHQVLSDPYRSKSDKDAARARLDQISGIVRERSELDKNAFGLDRLANQVAALQKRVEILESRNDAGTPGPAEDSVPQQLPPVEPSPQETKSDAGGQKQGRPKNRYQVEGERGNWGIRDSVTGLYVWTVSKKRKDADKICRDLNAGRKQVPTSPGVYFQCRGTQTIREEIEARGITIKTPAQREAQAYETQEEKGGARMYQSHEEKPAPPEAQRPDKTQVNSGVGRVPWYAK
jgi:hypothetical protein